MTTALVASDDTLLLEPLEAKQAREILGNLLMAWKVGMGHPLPVAVKTAFASVAINVVAALGLMWPMKLGGLALATTISATFN